MTDYRASGRGCFLFFNLRLHNEKQLIAFDIGLQIFFSNHSEEIHNVPTEPIFEHRLTKWMQRLRLHTMAVKTD
jgi:hypothetical protein